MSNIDGLIKDYKNFDELKIFCEIQFKQILSLNKKIRELEEKNKELLAKNSVASLPNVKALSDNKIKLDVDENDAKTIAQVQLKFLKDIAFERELVLDEAKRLEIYNRILNAPIDKEKPLKANAKVLDSKDLLQMIEAPLSE